MAAATVIRSTGARGMNAPRTISSSVRRAQSPASRWVRNVLTVIGQPALRMIAFHLPDGVFTRVAIEVSRECGCRLFVPALYLKLYPNSNVPLNKQDYRDVLSFREWFY